MRLRQRQQRERPVRGEALVRDRAVRALDTHLREQRGLVEHAQCRVRSGVAFGMHADRRVGGRGLRGRCEVPVERVTEHTVVA